VIPLWPMLTELAFVPPMVTLPFVPLPVLAPLSMLTLPEEVLVPEPSPEAMVTAPVLSPVPPVVLPERKVTADEAPAPSADLNRVPCSAVPAMRVPEALMSPV